MTVMGFASAGVASVCMPSEVVERWEAAYSQYGDQRNVAEVSAAVGALWREMAGTPGNPWWLVAALSTAAEAFDQQARDWAARQAVGGRVPRRPGG